MFSYCKCNVCWRQHNIYYTLKLLMTAAKKCITLYMKDECTVLSEAEINHLLLIKTINFQAKNCRKL